MANIPGGDSGDGNSTILGEVNAVVLRDVRHLLRRHPSEGEHSNLVSDVLPVAAGSLKHIVFFNISVNRGVACNFQAHLEVLR